MGTSYRKIPQGQARNNPICGMTGCPELESDKGSVRPEHLARYPLVIPGRLSGQGLITA
jgi:hypothetical protein